MAVAVARVSGRHDLAPKWLNDAAASFVSATFDRDDCTVLIDGPTRFSPSTFAESSDRTAFRDFPDLSGF